MNTRDTVRISNEKWCVLTIQRGFLRLAGLCFCLFWVLACAPKATETEDAKPPVTVGYQGIINPWKVAIQKKAFTEATGRTINWRKFSSGSEVISAMASGDVQLAVAGSSPIATAMSRGLDVELVWIMEAIQDNEALVVREGSGIQSLQDLKGKTIGVPFASTTHYHLLFALEDAQIPTSEVKLLNLQPDAIAASWAQDRIDAAFVWSPVLDQLKASGNVILTSGELAAKGRPTFDGLIAQQDFAHNNADFMQTFLTVIAEQDKAYREAPESWSVDSEPVKAISQFMGAPAENVVSVLKLYGFPSLEEQVSSTWLGGDASQGAPKALAETAVFLKAQQSISDVLPDYSGLVNPSYAQAALQAVSQTP